MAVTVRGTRFTTTIYANNQETANIEADLIKGKLQKLVGSSVEFRLDRGHIVIVKTNVMTLSAASGRMNSTIWQGQKDGYRNTVRMAAVIKIIGDLELPEVTTTVVDDLIRVLLEQDKAPATINRYLSTLRALLNRARDYWEVIEKVPRFTMQKEPEGRVRVITAKEEAELLDTYSKAAFIVLLDTGMRLGELLSLDPKDVDLQFKKILLRGENTKAKKRRVIPMTPRVVEYIFEAMDLSETEIRQSWAVAREYGNINDPEFVIHACRHTCASRLVQRGVPLMVVRDLLGHSSVQVTEKYAHVNQTDLTEAMKVLE